MGLASHAAGQSETLVNKTWEHSFGTPKEYEWAASTLDNAGNLLTTGNKYIDTANTKLLLIKHDPAGNVLWQKQFQVAANTRNGGVALTVDASNNVYVAGVTSTSADQEDFDFLVMKYNSNGAKIWHQTYDGPGNGLDVPTGIVFSSPRLYVCGASRGSGTGIDYWVMRFTASNGTQNWEKRYDYAGLDDFPANMTVDGSGNAVVTGSSAASLTNWEVATAKYAASNGVLQNVNRVSNGSSLGLTKPSAITKDPSGNFIIAGIKTTNGIEYGLRIIKLTSSLGVTWVQDYSSGAKVDSVSAVACDASGNIALTGWSSTEQGGSDILTLKYMADGTLDWERKRTMSPENNFSKGRAIATDADGGVVVAGDVKDYLVLTAYDSTGNTAWEKEIAKSTILHNRPLSLLMKQGEIFLTTVAKKPTGNLYYTYRLSTLQRPQIPVLDTLGASLYLENEVIVRFKPDVIKTSFIDNKDLRYGLLSEIIADTTCLQTIADKLSDESIGRWTAVKIHRNMTTADSVATTRLGREIKVPDFYNTLVLLVPEGSLTLSEQGISDSLESGDLECYIGFAEVNRIVESLECEPNDPLYPNQHNLNPDGTFPNANINVEQAWCAGATGSSEVKVAMIDTGVRWTHEDFGDGTFSGSVIDDGFLYASNTPLSSNSNNDIGSGHGTKMSGIVAAIRNNNKGIAGISGGAGSADGTRLIGLQHNNTQAIIAEAIRDAVDEYSVSIINCSFGFNPFDDFDGTAAVREQLHHANRMGVIVCAGRGNIGQSGDDTAPIAPGTEQDEWVLCVGGTNSAGNYSSVAKYENVDVAAPAENSIVPTTSNTGDDDYTSTAGRVLPLLPLTHPGWRHYWWVMPFLPSLCRKI